MSILSSQSERFKQPLMSGIPIKQHFLRNHIPFRQSVESSFRAAADILPDITMALDKPTKYARTCFTKLAAARMTLYTQLMGTEQKDQQLVATCYFRVLGNMVTTQLATYKINLGPFLLRE